MALGDQLGPQSASTPSWQYRQSFVKSLAGSSFSASCCGRSNENALVDLPLASALGGCRRASAALGMWSQLECRNGVERDGSLDVSTLSFAMADSKKGMGSSPSVVRGTGGK